VIPVIEVPESEKPVSALSEAELIRRQNLVTTYVSRYKMLSVGSASLKDRDHCSRLLEKYSHEFYHHPDRVTPPSTTQTAIF
jgi:hypothetical protein